ncbi:MAG: hypothetical protein QXI51_06530 [Candidatus Korarchaeum sp.]
MDHYRGPYKAMLYIFERMLRLYFPKFTKTIVPSNYCLGKLVGKILIHLRS